MLFQATLITDLIAMAATLWGAFYLFARGHTSQVTIRAVIVLLLLSIFFFGAYNNLFYQVVGTASQRAILLILGLGTWYSLTFRLMSQSNREYLRGLGIVVYVLGGVTILAFLLLENAFVEEEGNALYVAHMRLGFPYILYGTFQVVIVSGILFNLLTGDRIGLTRQGKYFLVASIFPALAIVSGIVGLALLPRLPRIIPDLFIFSGIFLLGISVARHQTMIERRTTIQDLPVSIVTMLFLVGLYAYLAMQWGLPIAMLNAVVAFAILTHSVYDLAHELLERSRLQHESAFRQQLRQLENVNSSEETLQLHLQEGLDLLCKTVQAGGGFVAVRRDRNFIVIATRDSIPIDTILTFTLLACDDLYQPGTDQLPGIVWVMPAFEGQSQVAAIALRKPQAKLDYSTGDLDLLVEVAGQVGTIVSFRNRTPGRVEQLNRIVSEVRAKDSQINSLANEIITTISTNPDAEFVRSVEDGLRHYSDYTVLGQSPLAKWAGIDAGSHIERGKRLQKFLEQSIESFRPAGARPPEPLPRVWYSYVVLHDAYVEGVPNREVMARLYISEGTFNRTRRTALRALARSMMEKDKSTQPEYRQ